MKFKQKFIKAYECPFCKRIEFSQKAMQEHLKTKHRITKKQEEENVFEKIGSAGAGLMKGIGRMYDVDDEKPKRKKK